MELKLGQVEYFGTDNSFQTSENFGLAVTAELW